ncbi:B12-binding domain-containing radical SAM protein [Streptomyces sp. NPDC020965]|uniref:B12-binding domain-containing radical SAM protein n=1 Tax=Streptomyces sp. NPDC020965 TaxID=3365105 RepID=UPI0037A4F555
MPAPLEIAPLEIVKPLEIVEISPPVPDSDLTVWLADLTYTQQSISSEIMPQAIGMLATYASTRLNLANPVRIFKYPERLAEALRCETPPDIIGFSSYVWNSRLSLAFAKRIKEKYPWVTVVFGGPNYPLVPGEQEPFLRSRLAPWVDFYVDREGERAFAELLIGLTASGGETEPVHGTVPGVHSLDASGQAHLLPPGPRLASLLEVPSPYVTGLMDEFFDGALIPTIQTNRGCPFSCSFCVEGTKYYSKVAKKNSDRVRDELLYIGERMVPLIERGDSRNELLITDSNFGMFPEDLAICDAIVECQDTFGWPRYVDLTTGKNKRDRVLEAITRTRGTMTLSGSVQSLSLEVLAEVRRKNIDTKQLMEVALAASEQNTGTYSEVILGLPKDSKAAHFDTLSQLIAAGFDRLNMFQLTLLPGSDLWTGDQREQHSMETRFRIVPRSFGQYEVLGENLAAAEVDEVCVGLSTLPFPDYQDCREMNLFVSAAYNDATFGLLVKLLRAYGCDVFRWLELMYERRPGADLRAVLARFREETGGQLWASREEAAAHAEENIDDYITGRFGSNLLYTYRARMLTLAFRDLSRAATDAARATMEEQGALTPVIDEFIAEAGEYHWFLLADVLSSRADTPLRQDARFDLDAFAADPGPVERFALTAPGKRTFTLSPKQVELIGTYLAQFGDAAWGIGRMLTKVRFQDLVRTANLD